MLSWLALKFCLGISGADSDVSQPQHACLTIMRCRLTRGFDTGFQAMLVQTTRMQRCCPRLTWREGTKASSGLWLTSDAVVTMKFDRLYLCDDEPCSGSETTTKAPRTINNESLAALSLQAVQRQVIAALSHRSSSASLMQRCLFTGGALRSNDESRKQCVCMSFRVSLSVLLQVPGRGKLLQARTGVRDLAGGCWNAGRVWQLMGPELPRQIEFGQSRFAGSPACRAASFDSGPGRHP